MPIQGRRLPSPDPTVYLVLTPEPDPAKDPRARRTARALSRRSRVLIASTHPGILELMPPATSKTAESLIPRPFPPLPAALSSPPNLEAVIATDPSSLTPGIRSKIGSAVPIILSLSDENGELNAAPESFFDNAYRADAIWLGGSPSSLPRALRGRAIPVPGGPGIPDPRWMLTEISRIRRSKARSAPKAPSDYPLTSLVIPIHNALAELKMCLRSIRRNTPQPHEIILVDNASDAPTRRYLRSLRSVRCILNRTNRGFAAAINQGMKAARGRQIVWINSDTLVTPDWLKNMIDCLQSDDSLGAVGPMTNQTVGAQKVVAISVRGGTAEAMEAFAAAWSQKFAAQRQIIHRLTGFFILLRRSAFERIGLLDERFRIGCYEDFDYCLRLRQAGYRLAIAKDVFIFHHEHKSFGSDAAFSQAAKRNRDLFIEKWCLNALDFWDSIDPSLAFVPTDN